jgi:hypothetical protein
MSDLKVRPPLPAQSLVSDPWKLRVNLKVRPPLLALRFLFPKLMLMTGEPPFVGGCGPIRCGRG